MKVTFHRTFKKQYKKLPRKVQLQFMERLSLFNDDPYSAVLNVHQLTGEMSGYISMNVNGDVRALFLRFEEEVVFERIGTHSSLY